MTDIRMKEFGGMRRAKKVIFIDREKDVMIEGSFKSVYKECHNQKVDHSCIAMEMENQQKCLQVVQTRDHFKEDKAMFEWIEELMEASGCDWDTPAREYNAMFNDNYEPEDYEQEETQ